MTLLPSLASAQKSEREEVDIAFDSLAGSVVDGIQVFRAVNARLKQGDTRLRADRMRDQGGNIYLFEGNVRVIENADTIYADTLHYNGEDRIGQASGNVRMTDGRIMMSAPRATYFAREKRTVFKSGVTVADSLMRLRAESGTYWSKEEYAEFQGRVRLRQEHIYLEGDTVSVRRKQHQLVAHGNIFLDRRDSSAVLTVLNWQSFMEATREDAIRFPTDDAGSDRLILFGDEFFNDGGSDSTRVSGRVVALQITSDSTGSDSLWIGSEYMSFTKREDDSERLSATENVRLSSTSFNAMGDSLVYDRRPAVGTVLSSGEIFGNPFAWIETTRISSDTLRIKGRGSSIDTLRATGGVFVAEGDSASTRVRQVRGKSLVASFRSDSIRTMVFTPNAEALYFMEESGDQKAGAVRASADRIVLTFEDGSVSDIHVFRGVEGTFYPEELLDQVENLSGFSAGMLTRGSTETLRRTFETRFSSHEALCSDRRPCTGVKRDSTEQNGDS